MSFSWPDTIGLLNTLQDAAQVLMPILWSACSPGSRPPRARLEQLVAHGLDLISAVAYGGLWVAGQLRNRRPRDGHDPALALTSVVIGALGLAGVNRSFTRGWSIWIICIGLTVVTGARHGHLGHADVAGVESVRRNLFRKLAVIACVFVVGTAFICRARFRSGSFAARGAASTKSSREISTPPVASIRGRQFSRKPSRRPAGPRRRHVRILMLSVWERLGPSAQRLPARGLRARQYRAGD